MMPEIFGFYPDDSVYNLVGKKQFKPLAETFSLVNAQDKEILA